MTFLNENKGNQVNINGWKDFRLDHLFNIAGSKTTKKSVLESSGAGIYPYITTKATENGISGYYDIKTEIGNCLTVDSAVLGSCFYQEKDFSASDHVEVLRPKNDTFNKNHGLFIKTCIEIVNTNKYDYGYKYNQKRIADTIIQLPSKQVGNINVPDWEYINNYILNVSNEIKARIFPNVVIELETDSDTFSKKIKYKP